MGITIIKEPSMQINSNESIYDLLLLTTGKPLIKNTKPNSSCRNIITKRSVRERKNILPFIKGLLFNFFFHIQI